MITIKLIKKCTIYFLASMMLWASLVASALSASYAGYWVSNDGKSPVPRSIVKFTQRKNLVTGKNYLMFYTTDNPQRTCHRCRGKLKNTSLIGLPIFKGHVDPKRVKQTCKILNGGDGRLFSCYFKLSKNAKVLTIRVYIGLKYFGRTLHWHRITWRQVKIFRGARWVRIHPSGF